MLHIQQVMLTHAATHVRGGPWKDREPQTVRGLPTGSTWQYYNDYD